MVIGGGEHGVKHGDAEREETRLMLGEAKSVVPWAEVTPRERTTTTIG
jgi:hypothetical protein